MPATTVEDAVPDSCTIEDAPSKLSVLVFVGNILLVAGVLLAILLVHIAVISGIEAYWLVKVREGIGFHPT